MTPSMFAGLSRETPSPARRMKVLTSFIYTVLFSLSSFFVAFYSLNMFWKAFLSYFSLNFDTVYVGFPLWVEFILSLWWTGFPSWGRDRKSVV